MTMNLTEQIITIALCAVGTMATRFLPFIIFRNTQPVPRFVQYLGKALPPAIFGMLVIYCLKEVSLSTGSHGIPEAIAIAVAVGLHVWQQRMLVSIGGSTICYMLLVQFVF